MTEANDGLFPKISQKGKTIIITGANTGLGYETARGLAELGAHVVMACRRPDAAHKAISQLQEDHKAQGGEKKLNLEFIQVDLSLLDSIAQFVKEFKRKGYSLHILICNAGTLRFNVDHTLDGHEQQFQVNYLGHVLLTLLLLPVMKRSGDDVRIINVTGNDHNHGKFSLAAATGTQDTIEGIPLFYANSKLYQVMFTTSLQESLNNVENMSVFSVNPGGSDTNLYSRRLDDFYATFHYYYDYLRGAISTDIQLRASHTVQAAIDPSVLKHKGAYLSEGQLETSSDTARCETLQKQLWYHTLDLLKNYITDEEIKEMLVMKS